MKPAKETSLLYLMFSVIVATVVAFATLIILIIFFFSFGLFGWSDGGNKDFLERLEMSTNITTIISFAIAFIVFIYTIFRMNKTGK